MNVLSSRLLRRGAALPAAAAVVLLLAPGPPASRLSAQAPPAKPLQHEVAVTVKLVQVYATGKGGAPVTDLTAADFEVTDNGKVHPVTHFEKHFLEAGEAAPAAPSTASGPSAALNRKFFLVFDFAFMDGSALLRAKGAALKFLEGPLLPSDEIGVVTYFATRGLVLNEYLTTDHARIRSIVAAFGAKPRAGRAENLTEFIYSSEFNTLPPSREASAGTAREVKVDDEFYDNLIRAQAVSGVNAPGRQSYVEQARQLMVALGQMAKVLRGVPGFKNIVLFSGGIARKYLYGNMGGETLSEWQTPEQLAAALSTYDEAQADASLRDAHTAMIREFKASNCPVYAVDVSRERRAADVSSQRGVTGARDFEGTDSLRQIASGTDGRFYANTMQEERVVTDIRTSTVAYYVLGYTADETYDGRFHRIKVKVKRKGVTVTAQGGYFSAKPFKDYTRFEKLLHVVDLALAERPELQVPYDLPVAALPLTVKGWPQALVFARASRKDLADVFGDKAEAYLLLLDEKGDIASIQRSTFPPAEEGRDMVLPSFLVRSKPGSYACRLVVRNLRTGRAARGAAELVVPAEKAAVLALDPPLLLAPERGAAEVPSSEGTSVSSLYGYDAAACAPLLGDVAAGTATLQVGLRIQGGAGSKGLAVSAFLIDAAGSARAEVPVTVIRQTDDAPARLLVVDLATGELKRGRYALECVVEEPASGEVSAASLKFTVK